VPVDKRLMAQQEAIQTGDMNTPELPELSQSTDSASAEVAFHALLVPLSPAAHETEIQQTKAPAMLPQQSESVITQAGQEVPATARELAEAAPKVRQPHEPPQAASGRRDESDVPPAIGHAVKGAAADAGVAFTQVNAQRSEVHGERQIAPPPQPPSTAAPEQPHPAVPKAAPVLRDIQIQVKEGSSRVDLRLAERAGEVRVDVRTPDSGLAGALRQDLPSLSTRLAQTGFHAETWGPATGAVSSRPTLPVAASSEADNHMAGNQGGSRQQDQERHQQPQNLKHSSDPNQDRKDFAWLFTSLR
jgi:hypothetical protein